MTAATRPLAQTRSASAPPALRTGVRDGASAALALAPVGMVVGAVTAEVMPSVDAWAAGPLLCSGSAQLALVAMVGSGASAAAVLLTVVAITSRCAVYGAALSSRFADQPRWFRWAGAYMLIDQVYVLSDARRDEHPSPTAFRHHYVGVAATIYLAWLAMTALGIALGPALPASWRLELALVVLVGTMLRGALGSRSAWLGAAVAAGVTVVATPALGGAGLVVGIVAGLIVRRSS